MLLVDANIFIELSPVRRRLRDAKGF